MSQCVLCNADIHDKRVSLGYTTCMICGDKEAQKVNARVNRIEKALTELEYKVADINVIVTFLNEFRRNNNENNEQAKRTDSSKDS